jgi:hypothetical protein
MKLVTALLIATTIVANANWFTELFESDTDKFIREIKAQAVEERARAEFQLLAQQQRTYAPSYDELVHELDAAKAQGSISSARLEELRERSYRQINAGSMKGYIPSK